MGGMRSCRLTRQSAPDVSTARLLQVRLFRGSTGLRTPTPWRVSSGRLIALMVVESRPRGATVVNRTTAVSLVVSYRRFGQVAFGGAVLSRRVDRAHLEFATARPSTFQTKFLFETQLSRRVCEWCAFQFSKFDFLVRSTIAKNASNKFVRQQVAIQNPHHKKSLLNL